MVSSNGANSNKSCIQGEAFGQVSSGAASVRSGPGTLLVCPVPTPAVGSGLLHLANSGCPDLKTCPARSLVSYIRRHTAANNYPQTNSPVRNVQISGGPKWYLLSALLHSSQTPHLLTFKLYNSMILKREWGEKKCRKRISEEFVVFVLGVKWAVWMLCHSLRWIVCLCLCSF